MTKESTKDLLQRLQDNVTNYDPKEWDGLTKEDLQYKYDICKHVSETLTMYEIMLIWYLRLAPFGSTHRFMKVAEKLSDAHQAFVELGTPPPDSD